MNTTDTVVIQETDHYPGSEKPGFPGVYKRMRGTPGDHTPETGTLPDKIEPSFAYWDGYKWFRDCDTAEEAVLSPHTSRYNPGLWEDFVWWGVVPPEGYTTMADEDGVIRPWCAMPMQSGFVMPQLVVDADTTAVANYYPEIDANFFEEDAPSPIDKGVETAAFVDGFFGE